MKNQKFERPKKEDLPKKVQEKLNDEQADLLLDQMESFAELLIDYIAENGQ